MNQNNPKNSQEQLWQPKQTFLMKVIAGLLLILIFSGLIIAVLIQLAS